MTLQSSQCQHVTLSVITSLIALVNINNFPQWLYELWFQRYLYHHIHNVVLSDFS